MRAKTLVTSVFIVAGTLISGCTPTPPPPSAPPATTPVSGGSASEVPVGSASPTSATPSTGPANAPTSFEQYYTPSFPTLAFADPFAGGPTAPGDPDTREPVIWFGDYDERSIALHLALNTMAVPPNQCGMVEASPDVETLRANAERYANCLLDSWRPFASSQGIELVPIEVVVDRLVARGYLERTANPDDRRQVLLKVSPHGGELGHEFLSQQIFSRALAERSDADLALFTEILADLTVALNTKEYQE